MLFPTVDFAVFLVVVLAVTWSLPAMGRAWKGVVLVASYVFYGWWDWHFCLLLGAVTVVNQLAAESLPRLRGGPRRALLAATVGADLLALLWFKDAGWLSATLAGIETDLHLPPSPVVSVLLPVGISFFTFQAISYVVDVHRGVLPPGRRLDVAILLSFFPHVVAGPIVRASELLPQLRPSRHAERIDATRALTLITGGLLKKVVLASYLATAVVDPVYALPGAHSSMEIVVATYAYAVQIWADFSGYTDIAIGVALLLGVRFPQNFNAPYTARSLRDFWRRWHITLSRWLRDYLYIPLGGSRGGGLFTARNLVITMVLGGIWHGAAWTFVIWGLIHGVGLVVERGLVALRARRHLGSPPLAGLWTRLVTFHVVCLGWLFFRADSLGTAWTMLTRIATARGPAPMVTLPVLGAVALGIAVQYVPRDLGARLQTRLSEVRPALQGAVAAAALVAAGALGPQGVAPFIYFRF